MLQRLKVLELSDAAREVHTLRAQWDSALQVLGVIDRGAINPSGTHISAGTLSELFEAGHRHPKRGAVARVMERARVPETGAPSRWYRRDIVAGRDSIEAVARELFQELQEAVGGTGDAR